MNLSAMAICVYVALVGTEPEYFCRVDPKNVRCYSETMTGEQVMMTRRNCEVLRRRKGGTCVKVDDGECREPSSRDYISPPPPPPAINQPKW